MSVGISVALQDVLQWFHVPSVQPFLSDWGCSAVSATPVDTHRTVCTYGTNGRSMQDHDMGGGKPAEQCGYALGIGR